MLFLDTSFLSATDISYWRYLLKFALRQLSIDQKVQEGARIPLDEKEEFVFISSSQVLSRHLLTSYKHIYISPQQLPQCIDLYLYQQLLTEKNNEDFNAVDVVAWLQTLTPAIHHVSLLSSVFSADAYLPSFLENITELTGYDNCEHFLIRPGSPGLEHPMLVKHVRNHPGAIYINLKDDPGLYQVWNIGVRLATAPYLSNANLDDRRAPSHLTRLCNTLDEHPDVALASSRLQTTYQPNLPWTSAANCSQMFANVQGGRFTAANLMTHTGNGIRPQNLPHCMPVWRRRLHADYGEFDEKNFGPSADWEFWLRAGAQGESFYFLPEFLGLYLKNHESYWHRQDKSKQEHFDRKILQKYTEVLHYKNQPFHQPLAMDIALAQRLLSAHNYGSGICWLLRSLKRACHYGPATQKLLATLCQNFLGCSSFGWGSLLSQWNGKSEGLLSFMVNLTHNFGGSVDKPLYRVFDFAFIDWYEMTGNREWLLLRALLARLTKRKFLEAVLLKTIFEKEARWFWHHWQTIYRFTVPLKEMTSLLGCMSEVTQTDPEHARNIRLHFFPDYRSSNSYLELLYHSMVKQGGRVQAISTSTNLEALCPIPDKKNILHIHWIQAIFKDSTLDELNKRADNFLAQLLQLQQKGFSLYWTVHNRLSHDGQDSNFEFEFRKRLAAAVDRIYLHHPLALELLEWLDHRKKVYLVEHGPYATPTIIDQEPRISRKIIGLDPQKFVLCHLGLIREYKGLRQTLPVILGSLPLRNNVQVVVAGRIVGPSLQKWLRKQRHPGLLMKEERLSQTELDHFMHAADFGFLSYRDILTSGSLFHWFSSGRPVIAPAKGTIPAYVVDGWNGFLYTDESDLSDILMRATALSVEAKKQMGINARTVAKRIKWEFFC
nr:glycosyltransferase [uncultured Desulfobulbus sp.]